MSRGRLIWEFLCRIAPIDTASTSAADAGTGYDEDFREPITRSDGTTATVYGPENEIPCQVETERDELRGLRQTTSNDDESAEVVLVLHFEDLEEMGLVHQGRALIKKGDRLIQVSDIDGEVLDDYQSLEMVVTEARPESYGLSGLKRNLLIVRFAKRKKAN